MNAGPPAVVVAGLAVLGTADTTGTTGTTGTPGVPGVDGLATVGKPSGWVLGCP